MRRHCGPVRDQGNIGSCTGQALCSMVEFLHGTYKHDESVLSPMFLYYNERVIEDTVAYDDGAEIRDGMKSLAKQGVCQEKLWPYSPSNFAVEPSALAYAQARDYLIGGYQRLDTLQDMLTCLSNGFCFVFGFSVYESFESLDVERTGSTPMPDPTERMLGGHAVMAVGYDIPTKKVFCRNSWGSNWGMSGYFTIPFDYLSDRGLSDDFWMARR
jgi:C1A family cysteine protease